MVRSFSGDSNCHQDPTTAPSYTSGQNPNQGPAGQPQAIGNITGWDPTNPNVANLTGVVFPKGVRDPYVYNFYLDVQHEIMPKTVIDVKYVGTAGHKLFRAEDVNRVPGSYLPAGVTGYRQLWAYVRTGLGGRLNPNYLKLRVWENQVNSNYNSLQLSVKHQMSHGLLFNVDYTYSHSIDDGSTWHSGATSANGAAAGEGYTTSNTDPGSGSRQFHLRHSAPPGPQLRLSTARTEPEGRRGLRFSAGGPTTASGPSRPERTGSRSTRPGRS